MNRILLGWVLLSVLSGCANLGDIVIPPHPNSDFRDPELTCLKFEEVPKPVAPEEMGEEFLLQGASFVIGWAIDQSAKIIEKEASRYSATYSARTSGDLYKVLPGRTRATKQYSGFTLARYFGPNVTRECNKAENGEKVFKLEAGMEINDDGNAIEIIPRTLYLAKTKAKVPALSWWPHTWWRIIDKNSGKLELNATVVMTTISESPKSVTQETIMKAEIPLGKFELTETAISVKFSGLSSGWFPLPHIKDKETKRIATGLPITVTVTITESDSLGDVLAKVSKKIIDDKSKLTDDILKLVGLTSSGQK